MDGFSLYTSNAGNDQRIITAAVNGDPVSATGITENIYRKLDSLVADSDMRILHERAFGKMEFYEHFTRIRKDNCCFGQNHFSYVEGKPCCGEELAGVQIHAVKPASNEDYWGIHHDGIPCGYGWKRNDVTYIYLTGITGSTNGHVDRQEQTVQMFDKIKCILQSQNIDFRNVVRTWIYLADILEWYPDFNRIRTSKYKEFNIIPENIPFTEIDHLYLPASTGISGKNPMGVSGISDVLAIAGNVQINVLPGMSQRSAYRYGSAFSRSICIQESDHRQVFISGTASIDDRGTSLHRNNIEAQITRTLECVESLLSESESKLTDIQAATVFLKRPDDLSVFHKVAKSFGLENLPAIYTIADICREELLFEMDAHAITHQ